MTNTEAFMDEVKKSGLKFKAIAEMVGLTANGLRKKVQNESEFKASEITKCAKVMHLTNEQRDIIFLQKR